MTNAKIIGGGGNIGGLVGKAENTAIVNSYVEGDIAGITHTHDNGNVYVGGLVGSANNVEIKNSYAKGHFLASSFLTWYDPFEPHLLKTDHPIGITGGLVGIGKRLNIQNSYTNIDSYDTDKFHSYDFNSIFYQNRVHNSFAMPYTLPQSHYTGGLVGYIGGLGQNGLSTLKNNYVSGNMKASRGAGGLIGYIAWNTDLVNSYVAANIHAEGQDSDSTIYSGGLVGRMDSAVTGSTINSSHFMGNINGKNDALSGKYIGGLVGRTFNHIRYGDDPITINNSSFNSEGNSQLEAIGEDGNAPHFSTVLNNVSSKSLSELQKKSNFSDWDFDKTWAMNDGEMPTLKAFEAEIIVNPNPTTPTMPVVPTTPSTPVTPTTPVVPTTPSTPVTPTTPVVPTTPSTPVTSTTSDTTTPIIPKFSCNEFNICSQNGTVNWDISIRNNTNQEILKKCQSNVLCKEFIDNGVQAGVAWVLFQMYENYLHHITDNEDLIRLFGKSFDGFSEQSRANLKSYLIKQGKNYTGEQLESSINNFAINLIANYAKGILTPQIRSMLSISDNDKMGQVVAELFSEIIVESIKEGITSRNPKALGGALVAVVAETFKDTFKAMITETDSNGDTLILGNKIIGSVGDYVIDAAFEAIKSYVASGIEYGFQTPQALAKFKIDLTIQLTLLTAKQIHKDAQLVIDIQNQLEENLHLNAEGIVGGAALLSRIELYKTIDPAKAERAQNDFDKIFSKNPVAEFYGLTDSNLTRNLDFHLSRAVMMKAEGKTKELKERLELVRNLSKGQGLKLSVGGVLTGIYGYEGYVDKMIDLLNLEG